ncbi:MAG: small ribosomal subunit Rsm22 family protein [Bdellovibrionota bacterium]
MSKIKVKTTGSRTNIPNSLIDSWKSVLITQGKFPKGTNKGEHKPDFLVKILARSLKRELAELWGSFTQSRKRLTENSLTGKKEAMTYLLGFHLANIARYIHTIEHTNKYWDLPLLIKKQKKINIIDLGCGSGALAQSNLWFVLSSGAKAKNITIKLVDKSNHLLNAATAGLDEISKDVKISCHKGDLTTLHIDKYTNDDQDTLTIINLGYIWNELCKNKKASATILRLIEYFNTKQTPCIIIVLEPGSQNQSRDAMGLREHLIHEGYTTLYPCPHNIACPLLEKSRDWCYREVYWTHPPIQKYIDNLMQIERTILATSSYVFANSAAKKQLSEKSIAENIIVGRPKRLNNNKNEKLSDTPSDYLLCTTRGLKKIPITKRPPHQLRGEPLKQSTKQ